MTGSVLETRDVCVDYRGSGRALRGVSISARPGEVTAILGPNGAGKTSLVRAIGGFMPGESGRVSGGRVAFDGVDITRSSPRKPAHLGIRIVSERDNVFRGLTVAENLALSGRKDLAPANAAQKFAFGLFPALEQRRSKPAGILSGGERQMLALSMALVGRPTALICDEVTSGIAPQVIDDLMRAIQAQVQGGLLVVLVEQQLDWALRLAQRVYVLASGRCALESTGDALRKDPDLLRAGYFGEPKRDPK